MCVCEYVLKARVLRSANVDADVAAGGTIFSKLLSLYILFAAAAAATAAVMGVVVVVVAALTYY